MLGMVDVEVGYGRTSVIHGVTIEVPADGVVAVMGHNGAGKTTLLRAAVGLLPTRSGRILLDGEDVTGMPPHQRVRRGLAYVPQGQQSFGQLTTLENLQVVADTKPGSTPGPLLGPWLLIRFGSTCGGCSLDWARAEPIRLMAATTIRATKEMRTVLIVGIPFLGADSRPC